MLETRGRANDAVVSDGYTRTRLNARRSTRAIAPLGVRAAERALISGLPPRPAFFLLYFDEGTVNLTPESRAQIAAIRDETLRRPGAELQVIGHADTLGAREDNDALSEQRAKEIVARLAAAGISLGVMTALGRGEGELREATADGVRSRANRRAEVTVR